MKNGSVVEVPHDGTVVYYLGRGNNQTLEPFPPGLRMLSGSMTARSYDSGTSFMPSQILPFAHVLVSDHDIWQWTPDRRSSQLQLP